MNAVRTLRLKDKLNALWRGDGEVNIHAGTGYHLDVHKQRWANDKQQRMLSHSRNFNPFFQEVGLFLPQEPEPKFSLE